MEPAAPEHEEPVCAVRVPQDRVDVAVVSAEDSQQGVIAHVVDVDGEGRGKGHVDAPSGDDLSRGREEGSMRVIVAVSRKPSGSVSLGQLR